MVKGTGTAPATGTEAVAEQMRVTLIATVLNEAESLAGFLTALLSQTRPPDEIILTDGGSTDGSLEIIRKVLDAGAPLEVIVAAGANIARGRNLAIRQARGDIIASTDAGCRADPRWLEELTAPFQDPLVHVVGGFSLAEARTRREKSFGIIFLDDPRRLDPNTFGPSSRSVAFRKPVWESAGGYPEELYSAEDTVFNQRMRHAGARFVFRPQAVVRWLPPRSLGSAARKFFSYGRGDGRAGLSGSLYRRILLKAVLVLGLAVAGFVSGLFWVLLLLSFPAYYLRTILVNRHRGSLAVNSLVFLHRLPLDGARFVGYLCGRLDRMRDPKFRRLVPAGGRGAAGRG